MTPWGKVRLRLHRRHPAGPGQPGQPSTGALREVLSVEVMQALKQSELKLREAAGDGGKDGKDSAVAEVDEDQSSGAGGVGGLNVEVSHQPGPATTGMPERFRMVECRPVTTRESGPRVAGAVKRWTALSLTVRGRIRPWAG